MKTLPAQLSTEKDKVHYQPIYLVDINSLGFHWATRAVTVRMYDGGFWDLSSGGPFTYFDDPGETFLSSGIAAGDLHTLVSDEPADYEFTIDRVASETRLYWTESWAGGQFGLSYRVERSYTEALMGVEPGKEPKLGIGEIRESIDFLGGVSSIGNMKVSLLNQELLSDQISVDALNDAKITVRILMDDGSTLMFDESLVLFEGYIDDVVFDDEKLELSCIKSDIKRNIIVPKTKVNLRDYPYAPEENIGLPLQRVYGNFWDGHNVMYDILDLVPAILVDSRDMTFVIADHILKGLTASAAPFMELPGVGTIMTIDIPNGSISNSTPPAKITLSSPVVGNLKIRKYGVGNLSDVDDIYPLSDKKSSTYVTVSPGEDLYLKIPDLSSILALPADDTDYQIQYELGDITGGGTATIRYSQGSGSTGKSITSADANTISLHTFGTDDSDRSAGPWTWEELASLTEFGLTCDGSITVEIKNFTVSIFSVIIFASAPGLFEPQGTARPRGVGRIRPAFGGLVSMRPKDLGAPPDNLFIKCRGKAYDDWVDTPGRSNSKNSGDTIKNGAGIVEDLLRYAGFSDEEIDLDSFDTLLTDDYFWGVIREEINLFSVIDNICRQSRTKLFKTSDDRHSVIRYNASASLITDGVFKENPNIESDAYSENPIVGKPLISKLRPDEIFNSVHVNYHYDFVQNTPRRSAFVSVVKESTNSRVDEPDTGIDDSTDPITFDVDIIGADDASEFAVDDHILIDQEIMKVTAVNTTTDDITCSRAQKGTSIAAHPDNSPIFKLISDSDDGTGTRDQNGSSPDDREDQAMLSVAENGVVNEYTIDADWIRDDDEAQYLREFLFDRLSNRLYICEIATFMNGLHVDLGDFINIQHSVLEGLFTDMTSKKWEVIEASVIPEAPAGQVELKTIEV